MRARFEPEGLQQLRALRRQGKAPSMPVFITDDFRKPRQLEEIGCLLIRVKLDERQDWSPLGGMDVILQLNDPRSVEAYEFYPHIRNARPRRLESFENGKLLRLTCLQ